MTAAVVVAVVVIGVLLMRLQMTHVRRVADARRSLLAGVRDALDHPDVVQRGIDYPVLTGGYRGAPVTIALIVDTLRLRELPTLWLSVTRRQPLPIAGPIDMLLRASPMDIVSPGERFPAQHPVPPNWPEHIRVATPQGDVPDLAGICAVLPLLHSRRTKDVLLTPNGARVIVQLARAELGHYRLVKRADFKATLSVDELTGILDALCDMTEGIRAGAGNRSGVAPAGTEERGPSTEASAQRPPR